MQKIYSFNLNPVKHIQMKSQTALSGAVVIEVPMEHQNCIIKNIVNDNCKNTSGNCFEDEFLLFEDYTKDEMSSIVANLSQQCPPSIKYYALIEDDYLTFTAYQLFKKKFNEVNIKK